MECPVVARNALRATPGRLLFCRLEFAHGAVSVGAPFSLTGSDTLQYATGWMPTSRISSSMPHEFADFRGFSR
jgi:hypothetical protein